MKPPIRVLVADDNEDHVFLIVRALRSEEGVVLEVETAGDGEEALDHLYRRGRFEGRPRPDLVLLDLKMPKVSGLEVLEQVKGDPEMRDIPIVVLSSSERPEDISDAYRLGGNSYVTKPSNLAGLRAGVRGISRYWTEVAALPGSCR
jgi:CheY-like chemotaxis protein